MKTAIMNYGRAMTTAIALHYKTMASHGHTTEMVTSDKAKPRRAEPWQHPTKDSHALMNNNHTQPCQL